MDDIVSRLRQHGYVSPPRNADEYSKLVSCSLLIDAADEIEKLRDVASRAADIIDAHLYRQREKVEDASSILREAVDGSTIEK